MSRDVSTRSRQPKGRPTGGEFATEARAETILSQPLDAGLAAARLAHMDEQRWVPAAASASTTDQVDRWWMNHQALGEYRADGTGVPQMDDDANPTKYAGAPLTGNSLAGIRRVYRRRYAGDDLAIRMPAAAAIKRFAAHSGHVTFDVPVAAQYQDPDTGQAVSVDAWVRVTRDGDRWNTRALGFPDQSGDGVGEAVAAVLESRTPSRALTDMGSLLAARRERAVAFGAEPVTLPGASWLNAIAYDPDSHVMVTQTRAGRVYGHLAPAWAFTAVNTDPSAGRAWNQHVKGRPPVEVTNCPACGRFTAVGRAHTCPDGAAKIEGANLAARAVAGYHLRTVAGDTRAPATPAPVPPAPVAPPVKTVDADRWIANNQPRAAVRHKGTVFGYPYGYSEQAARALLPFADETHTPYQHGDGGYPVEALDLIRFNGADAQAASVVAHSLPKDYLRTERHNDAPTIGTLLGAAQAHDGKIELGGYVVGQSRDDERVTVDAVDIYDPDLAGGGEPETDWQVIAERYRLSGKAPGVALEAPSEFTVVENKWRPGERAYRLWWD